MNQMAPLPASETQETMANRMKAATRATRPAGGHAWMTYTGQSNARNYAAFGILAPGQRTWSSLPSAHVMSLTNGAARTKAPSSRFSFRDRPKGRREG